MSDSDYKDVLPDKILRADGAVVDSDDNVIVPPSELGRHMFKTTEPRIGKVLKRDGSIVEETGGGGGGQGPPGPPGPPGPAAFISVYADTETEYILLITNEAGDSFLTPNLKTLVGHIGFF